jgi:hypothetical protein
MNKIIDDYYCKICNKKYATYNSLWTHNKKYHVNKEFNVNIVNFSNNIKNNKSLTCEYCKKIFNNRPAKSIHRKKCKKIIKENKNDSSIDELELEINELKKDITNTNDINQKLINIIVEKNKAIEELNIDSKLKENTNQILPENLILNNVQITSRIKDNYINAVQICLAGNKKFNKWFNLNTTKNIFYETAKLLGVNVSQLVNISDGNIWIHPYLSIQLAQWISPYFGLHVNVWINASLIKLLEEKNKEIESKDQKIKLLEDTYIKQQKRKNYPGSNVIYLVTSDDNKKKRIYIFGKSKRLKDRLGPYNKIAEHDVVYYKSCNSEREMTAIETLVLKKLDAYREKANRDRFILPVEKDIKFFINIIDSCIETFN